MVTIFAGLDTDGVIRYLNDVPSGQACGCICLTCGAPLIARKGEINEWHFAHQSGQQNEGCLVGAQNHIRRLVAELLQLAAFRPTVPDFVAVASCGAFDVNVSMADPVEGAKWLRPSGEFRPAAELALGSGAGADLYISVGDDHLPRTGIAKDRGVLLASVAVPEMVDLRSREDLATFIERTISYQWLHLPDTAGLLEAAYAEAAKKDADYRNRLAAAQLERSQAAGRRWGKIRSTAAGASDVDWEDLPVATQGSETKNRVDLIEQPMPSWAWFHKPHSSCFAYLFTDGSQWVLHERTGHGFLLSQWPEPEDGWDEALPPSVGHPDLELNAYRIADLGTFFMASGSLVASMRNTSNPKEVAGLFTLMRT